MKFFLPALLFVLLASCTKQTLTVPKNISRNITANSAVSYQDNSISIIDFKAQQDARHINVTFTTLYEKDIVKLEVLKGLTENNLCSIYMQEVSADSYSVTKYSTLDQESSKVDTIYYMVKYTLANGDWGYTPIFQLGL